MTSGDTGSNDEMMAQLNEQLAPVISNYGTTVVTDTVTDADLLAALTAAGLTGEQQQAVLGAVGVAMGKALQNDTPAMVQGVAGTVSGVLMGQLGSGICQLQTGLDQLASGLSLIHISKAKSWSTLWNKAKYRLTVIRNRTIIAESDFGLLLF